MPFDMQLQQAAPGQHSKMTEAPVDVTIDTSPVKPVLYVKSFAVKGKQ